jgi:hypothetical protein
VLERAFDKDEGPAPDGSDQQQEKDVDQ